MRLPAGAPVAALSLSLVLASCGGGGGAQSALPSSPSAPSGGSSSSAPQSHTIAPSSTSGGAQSVQITEYSLGSTPSNGELTIAADGSVWTMTNGSPGGTGAFVRYDDKVTTVPLPVNAESNLVEPNLLAVSNGMVYGVAAGPTLYRTPSTGTGAAVKADDRSGQAADNDTALAAAPNGTVWWVLNALTTSNSQPSGFFDVLTAATGTLVDHQFLPAGPSESPQTYTTSVSYGPSNQMWIGGFQTGASFGPTIYDRFSLAGTYAAQAITPNADATPISSVLGPDGSLWATSSSRDFEPAIIQTMASGQSTAYPTAAQPPVYPNVAGITVGSDGALWFTEPNNNAIGRITVSGQLTTYALPTPNSEPLAIVGPGSGCAPYTLWFAEAGTGKIAELTYK